MRSWSKACSVKTAKVVAKTVWPIEAMPAAAEIMFCSATPKVKKRSGNSSANLRAEVDLPRSASTTTRSRPSC